MKMQDNVQNAPGETVQENAPGETIVAPFDDQFPDVKPEDKVWWQFTVPTSWKENEPVIVVLPSKLELSFVPLPGSKPGEQFAFPVPRAETVYLESESPAKKAGLIPVELQQVQDG